MVALNEDERIANYLAANSRRPLMAVLMWMAVRSNFDPETQEVTVTRAELAERFKVHKDEITRVFALLVQINALRCWKDDFGGQRYELSPSVATHLKGQLRDQHQYAFGPLRLVGGGDNKPEPRADRRPA
jgi:hypothetical protein